MDVSALIDAAKNAAGLSYSPYSRFRVGAALLCTDGTVYTGTNVENRSFGLTNCAERSAIFTAVSRGNSDFKAIAIFSPDSNEPIPPCGACRQVLSEFVSPDFPIYFSGTSGTVVNVTMGDMLPHDSLHDLAAGD
jgi:cytidine deaminase